MENLNVCVKRHTQLNEEKLPLRVCPRCNSKNTKFCYYNNYSVSQPRYKYNNCRRYWTDGRALRNIPILEVAVKSSVHKETNLLLKSNKLIITNLSHMFQKTNEFVGCWEPIWFFAFNGVSISKFPPIDRSDFHNGSFQLDNYDLDPMFLLVIL
ncbi:hypothetical protein Bca52824_088735 [Brassica carinata]|uniref:Dof zinc finger protein n=1 Tax=Brassica carinata TaxID=52824 RepID=A0A8X7TP30_BRACI|nr:hypothetical protein Bca52824_088735 [Brassica carinata]